MVEISFRYVFYDTELELPDIYDGFNPNGKLLVENGEHGINEIYDKYQVMQMALFMNIDEAIYLREFETFTGFDCGEYLKTHY